LVGRNRKEIPYNLKRLAKRHVFRTTREAQKWFDEHGLHLSLGWLSINKTEWKPSREEQKSAEFREEDSAFDTDLAARIMHMKGLKPEIISETRHFTREQLERFSQKNSQGCADFANECLLWKGKSIIFQDYQYLMVDGWLTRKGCVYPMGRGIGKDFTLAIFLIWLSVCFPNTRSMVVCPASRQVKTFINENLHIMMYTSGVLYDSIQRMVEEEFMLTNGSIVFTFGATSFIKGKHNINYIFANEAAEIPEHVFENVLGPMLGTAEGGGHYCLLGVPGGQAGFFWKVFQSSTTDINNMDSDFFCMNLPTSRNKYYSREQLTFNKSIMSEDAYLQEHEAQFLDIEGALFTQNIIDKMKKDYEPSFGIVDNEKYYYILGVDWGRISAYSVYTALSVDKKTGHVKIDWIEANRKEFTEQYDWIEASHKIYNFRTIIVERMGIGIPASEEVKHRLGSKVVRYFTPETKTWFEAFSDLRDLAVNDKISIPAGELRLIRQLRLMSFVVKGGTLTVKSEGKDDFSQSLAIAVSGISKSTGAGVAGVL